MKDFLEKRQDFYLINKIAFGEISNLNNVRDQLKGLLFKIEGLEGAFKASIDFLQSNLDSVTDANKSLDIIESRLQNIKDSIDFILKSRFEISENSKSISIVELSKGNFNGLMFNIDLKGITFEKQ